MLRQRQDRMDETQRISVLRRKLGTRAPAAAAGPEPDAARHLARALARATSRIPGLVGSCAAPSRRDVSVTELVELVDGEAFCALIADPSGAVGLALFDPTCTVALIEAMTIGRLSRKPPPNRRATATDAQLLCEVIDAALAEFDSHAASSPEHRAGFRFQRFPADYRLLDLLLEAPRFDLIVQPLALLDDDVRRDGQFLLALPERPAPEAEVPDAAPASARRLPGTGRADAWSRALESQVMSAPAQLTAVLGRMTMPLSEVMALGVGSRLVLPLAKLEEVELEALDGQVLGLGRLGQFRAMRAIRLVEAGARGAEPPGFEDHSPTRPNPPEASPAEAATTNPASPVVTAPQSPGTGTAIAKVTDAGKAAPQRPSTDASA